MTSLKFLARGKRSYVYSGMFKDKKCAFKIKRQDSDAQGTIEREFQVLKQLNKQGIGPRVYGFKDGMLIMELIEGERILDFLGAAPRDRILHVLEEILSQLRKLDALGLEKGELVNPYKHIIITKKGVKLIDFERCVHRLQPKNITQFVTFLTGARTSQLLLAKRIFIRPQNAKKLSQRYKHSQNNANYLALKSEVLQKSLAHKIYFEASKIPKGKVTSYGNLARAINSRAFRAVGGAMHRNPFWPIVPCHRVISNDLSLGGFGTGVDKKVKLLKGEGIIIKKGKIAKENFLSGPLP